MWRSPIRRTWEVLMSGEFKFAFGVWSVIQSNIARDFFSGRYEYA